MPEQCVLPPTFLYFSSNIDIDLIFAATGEKPFQCETCQATFARNDYLKKHRALHLNPEGATCPVCRELFSTEEGVRKHVKAKHATTAPSRTTSGKEVFFALKLCIHLCSELRIKIRDPGCLF